MPRRAMIRTILATMIGLAIWLPATAASAADPCCQVSVSGLPSQFTAGAAAQSFGTSLSYSVNNGQRVQSISAVFTFSGNNITGSQIQLARLRDGRWHSIGVGRHNGVLTATDNFSFSGHDQGGSGSITSQYRLAFSSRVQSQGIQMRLTLAGRVNDGHHSNEQQLAQTGPYALNVAGANAAPAPTKAPVVTTPTPTPTPTVTPSAAAPTVAGAAPGDTLGSDAAGSGGGGSSIWIAYMIGGLLLIGGIGVIGTMLWKRGQAGQTGWEDPYAPEPVGGPYAPAPYGSPTYADPGYAAPTSYQAPATAYGAPTPTTYGPPPSAPPQHPTQPLGAARPPLDPTQHMPRQ